MDANGMHYDCDDSQKLQIKELMDKCGIETEREFFDCALCLFGWAVEQREKGRNIGTLKEDGSFESFIIPALECVMKNKPG